MFERTTEYYRRLNRPGTPEESKGFRAAVLVTVLISVFSAVRYGDVGTGIGITVLTGVVAGSFYSYFARKRMNLLLKAVLTLLLLVVFALFWSELTGSLNDLRYPLVRLFLWLQVLHSFDLPTRRDLDFSMVSATILMAFAGSLSLSTGFLFLLVLFAISAMTALYLGHRSSLVAGSDVFVKGGRGTSGRALILACVAVLPLTLAFFVLLPRFPSFIGNYLPMSNLRNPGGSFEGLIRNPGYPQMSDRFPTSPLPFNPESYQGFSRFLDLRVRGIPSDTVVMKVRSSEAAYWRATAFDRFLGSGWENTDKTPEEIAGADLPLSVSNPDEPPRFKTHDLVQTFFIQKGLPNTMFAAYLPRDVFFPTQFLKVDSMMTVMTPLMLEKGLIYTVVSEVSDATPDELRRAVGAYPGGIKERYCALPAMPAGAESLAKSVTAGETNDYDRVVALSEYLMENFTYDLKCPAQGNGENTVEFFLREKRGFCEHFATTLAVMCRYLGIPSRLAVGFSTGEFNPLTGYYEVSARDAHAWVEVYIPAYGWTQFDPTPGGEDVYVSSRRNSAWGGFTFFQYAGRALSRMFPQSWSRAVRGALRSVGSGARAFAGALAESWKGLLLVFAASALAALALWRVRSARRASGQARQGLEGPRQAAARIFERMAAALAAHGFPRRESQTPLEFATEAEARLGIRGVRRAAELFSRARFSRLEPGQPDIEALDRTVTEVERELGASGRSDRKRPGLPLPGGHAS